MEHYSYVEAKGQVAKQERLAKTIEHILSGQSSISGRPYDSHEFNSEAFTAVREALGTRDVMLLVQKLAFRGLNCKLEQLLAGAQAEVKVIEKALEDRNGSE